MFKRTKRMLSVLLCLVLLAGLLPGVLAADEGENPFTDVKESDYFYDAVIWAYTFGITTGTSKTAFSPWGACTRGQVVTFLWRAMGQPIPKTAANPFSDVPETAYYRNAVLWAVEKGITNGTGKDAFSPDTPCSYAHILTFLWRTVTGNASSSYGSWYEEPMDWANKKGLLQGTALGQDGGKAMANCPRCDVVTYLWRALKPDPNSGPILTETDAQKYVKAILDLIMTGTYDESVTFADIDEDWDAEIILRERIEVLIDTLFDQPDWMTEETRNTLASALMKGLKKAEYEVGIGVKAEYGYDVPVVIKRVDLDVALSNEIGAATERIMDDPDFPSMSKTEIYNRILKDAGERFSSWLDDPEYLPPVTINVRFAELVEGLFGLVGEDGTKLAAALFGFSTES